MGEDRPVDLQLYADHTAIHGIRDFVSTKSKVLKVIWGICLLAAGGLLCEQVYRTVKNYQTEPTSFAVKVVDMDWLPTIHVCVESWFDDTQLRSLGFDDQDVAYLCWYLGLTDEICMGLLWNPYPQKAIRNFSEAEKTVKQKMKNNNLTTMGDMLHVTTPTVLSAFRNGELESLPWFIIGMLETSRRLCYTVSNITFGSGHYRINMFKNLSGFLVVGEDPYSMQKIELDGTLANYTIDIWDVNKLTLLNQRSDYCNDGYNSREICLSDCYVEWAKCTCNLTPPVAFPYMNEDFWSLKPQHFWSNDCNDTTDAATRSSCDRRRRICKVKCKPCTFWNHQHRSSKQPLMEGLRQWTQFQITVAKIMKITKEYYAFPTFSFISNIVGLMGLFCVVSLLSFVHAVVFWFENGRQSMKVKSLHGQKRGENQA